MDDEPGRGTQILDQLERVIAGQRESLETILATLLTGGHVLLQDRPGVGKTVLAKAIAQTLGIPTSRIQGTPDLLPTDVTGVHVYQPSTGEWAFRAGPVFTGLLLVDELNRATPKAQSALLEAMAEGQVSIDGETRSLHDPFMVIATQNPQGEVGTHPLGNAQLDRFATMVHLGLPGREAETAVLRGSVGAGRLDELGAVVGVEELRGIRAAIAQIEACDGIVRYILDIVDEARAVGSDVWLSVRVGETILAVARGRAFLAGRDHVAPEDVQLSVPAVLAHRLPRTIEPASIPALLAGVAVPVDAG